MYIQTFFHCHQFRHTMNRRERETVTIKEENMSDNEGVARPSSKRRKKTYGIITNADAIKV